MAMAKHAPPPLPPPTPDTPIIDYLLRGGSDVDWDAYFDDLYQTSDPRGAARSIAYFAIEAADADLLERMGASGFPFSFEPTESSRDHRLGPLGQALRAMDAALAWGGRAPGPYSLDATPTPAQLLDVVRVLLRYGASAATERLHDGADEATVRDALIPPPSPSGDEASRLGMRFFRRVLADVTVMPLVWDLLMV